MCDPSRVLFTRPVVLAGGRPKRRSRQVGRAWPHGPLPCGGRAVRTRSLHRDAVCRASRQREDPTCEQQRPMMIGELMPEVEARVDRCGTGSAPPRCVRGSPGWASPERTAALAGWSPRRRRPVRPATAGRTLGRAGRGSAACLVPGHRRLLGRPLRLKSAAACGCWGKGKGGCLMVDLDVS